jgi:hypothetical protein
MTSRLPDSAFFLFATVDPVSILFAAGLGVLALCTLACVGGLAVSLSQWRHLWTSTADEFRNSLDGPIEVTGPAQSASDSEPFYATVSAAECLLCQIEAEHYQSSGDGDRSWVSVESRTTTRPFVVESPAGTIRVEPTGAQFELAAQTVDHLSGDEPATGRTATFLDAVGVDRSVGSVDLGIVSLGTGDRYRIRERRVDVGEAVSVAGIADTTDPTVGGFGGPDAVIRAPTDRSIRERLFGYPFFIGDGGERALAASVLKRAGLFAVFALLFGGVWLVVLAIALS